MTNDERFVENLKQLARDLDPPVEPRREIIWQRIDAARRFQRRPVRRPRRGWYLGVGLAASLALGIAIGRYVVPGEPTSAPADPSLSLSQSETPLQQATTRHLARTEALLTSFSADAEQGRTQQVSDWAQNLLTDTRLLMDSPVGSDPRLDQLLEDLELVLAQIANLTHHDRADEIELIQAGIQQNDVLLRLRTATAEPMPSGT